MSSGCEMIETIEEQVERIWEILADVHGQSPWTKQQIKTNLMRPESQYLYAYHEGEIVGFIALQFLSGEWEISNLAIKSFHQGKGLASDLLARVLKHEEPVFLEVRASNQPALALYKKFGFEEIAVRPDYYHCPKEDAILMKGGGRDDR